MLIYILNRITIIANFVGYDCNTSNINISEFLKFKAEISKFNKLQHDY